MTPCGLVGGYRYLVSRIFENENRNFKKQTKKYEYKLDGEENGRE